VLAAAAAPPVAAPTTSTSSAAPKKKPNVFLFIVLALGAAGAFGALKLGLIGGHKGKFGAMPDRTPVPPPAAVEPPMPVKPAEPTPEEVFEKKREDAIALVQAWPPPAAKPSASCSPKASRRRTARSAPGWRTSSATTFSKSIFTLKSPAFPLKPSSSSASLADRSVTAHNAPAHDLLSGKSSSPKKARRKGKKGKGAGKKAAADDGAPMLQDILIVNPDDDKATPADQAPAERSRRPRSRRANPA